MKPLLRHFTFLRKASSRSQGMVEFALMLPVLLFLIYGMLEVGRLVMVYATVTSAAREAIRYGSASGLNDAGDIQRFKDCDGIKNAAQKVDFLGVITDDNILVTYDQGPETFPLNACYEGVSAPEVLKNGDRIYVQVESDFSPIIPILPWAPWTVVSSAARTILVDIEITGEIGVPLDTYHLDVYYGSGTGDYPAGAVVGIVADVPVDKIFDYWDGDTANVIDTSAESTALNMPANDIAVTAKFKDGWSLTVQNGTGSGVFAQGTLVTINATIPSGKLFDKWTGNTSEVADISSATTTVTMPAAHITVVANFMDPPSTTFHLTVNSGSGDGDYTQFTEVSINPEPPPAAYMVFKEWIDDINHLKFFANIAANKVTMPDHAVSVTATYYDPFTCEVYHSGAVPDGSDVTWTIYNHERVPITILTMTVSWKSNGGRNLTNVYLNGIRIWGPATTDASPFGITGGPWTLPANDPPPRSSNIRLVFEKSTSNIKIVLTFGTPGCSDPLQSFNALQIQP